jgi:MoaA/NifB/PqqE/SkfB family radical SAM enzyme
MPIVNSFCGLPFTGIKVSPDGQINMCCHQNSEAYLGNLFLQTFEEIWFGEKAVAIREATLAHRLHAVCNTDQCPFRYKNLKVTTEHQVNENLYPTHLEFDLHPSHCNFGGLKPTPKTACVMCPRSRPDFQAFLDTLPDRTLELVDRLKPLTPYLDTINVLGVAEPFWKDVLFQILERFEAGPQMRIWTTTNGSVFNSDRQDRFSQIVNHSHIHFSLDAATRETYHEIRQHDLFDQVFDNVRRWCRLREELNSQGHSHSVQIHNNINTLNVHEVERMVEQAKELGVDNLTLLPTHDCGGTHPDLGSILVGPDNYRVFLEAEQKARKKATSIGQAIYFTRPLALDFGPKPMYL